jgi:hypothetical protein
VNAGGVVVQRLVLEPGWRSPDSGGLDAATGWDKTPHLLYHAAGRIRIIAAGGAEFEAGPGEVVSLPPGCEAYVIGEDPVVIVDFRGAL